MPITVGTPLVLRHFRLRSHDRRRDDGEYLEAEGNSEATRELAFSLCTADIQPLADGEDRCDPIPTEVEDESATHPGSACFGGLSCVRPGTADGTEIFAGGGLYVKCEPYDTNYACKCGGSEVFAQDAADLRSACDAAVTRCPDLAEPSYRIGIYRA